MTDNQIQADQYRALFEQSADAILIIDGETFVDCNQATVDMLRYRNKEELLKTHPSELSPKMQPDGRESFEKANEMIAIAFERGSHRFEWDHKRADGEVFPVEVLLTAVPDTTSTKLHVVWRDITGKKQLESQLRQTQKIEAIGKLAGGIAHDFNNLLVSIIGNSELLQKVLEPHTENHELVSEIRWAGERAAELTNQLLAFSRKQVLQPVVFDLNDVLANIHKLLERLMGEDVQVMTRPSQTAVKLKADPGQIEQMLINLASNARDAMPSGGALTFETTIHRIEESVPDSALQLKDGEYVRLTISDTGAGMDEETLGKAFDPFYTTKPVGEGTGLGLATVHGIVQQSGGDLLLRSKVGEGTTVEVWFPTTKEALIKKQVPTADVPKGNETILVVEDDSAVASFVVRLLRMEGYTVLLAQDGMEALEVYNSRASDIGLILSDVIMPSMGGPEMVRRLNQQGHDPLVIFVSGHTDNAFGSVAQLGGHAAFLQKPYSLQSLLQSIRSVLDRKILKT
ncbi:MAG: response regulator [Candidatus Brocadiaceae bacterium]|nr:response regulator [Candidatus Brocadiaceae bacterium]